MTVRQEDSSNSSKSKTSSEKKRMMLKIRRFERRPPRYTEMSDDSSLQLSAIPHAMSESNLHAVDTPKETDNLEGMIRLKNELKMHFHNRIQSNPSTYGSPEHFNTSSTKSKVKASSRLMINRKGQSTRVSFNPLKLLYRMVLRQALIEIVNFLGLNHLLQSHAIQKFKNVLKI